MSPNGLGRRWTFPSLKDSRACRAAQSTAAVKLRRPGWAPLLSANATDAEGNGIMDICIRSLNYVTMQLLVSIGFQTSFSSHWAPLWMFAAVARDDSACLKVLLQHTVPTVTNTAGIPLLIDAIARKATRYAISRFSFFFSFSCWKCFHNVFYNSFA